MSGGAQNIGYGQAQPWDANDDLSVTAFIVRRMMAQMSSMLPVRVEGFHAGTGSPPGPGTVDVLPLINQLDGNGNAVKHGTVYGLACWRMRGGVWSIICDPVVGDIGFVIVADRDISAVKSSGGDQSNPGSYRKFNLSDGIYVGGILSPVGDSFIHLKEDGSLKISDALGNVLETSAAGFVVTTAPGGDFTVNGISVTLHLHGGVTTGAGVTGQPLP